MADRSNMKDIDSIPIKNAAGHADFESRVTQEPDGSIIFATLYSGAVYRVPLSVAGAVILASDCLGILGKHLRTLELQAEDAVKAAAPPFSDSIN